jgi:accessory gene regulator protein AgrB
MTNPFCKYKNAFGKPNEGIHSFRFIGISVIDVLVVVGVAYLISHFSGYNFWIVLAISFFTGIFVHRLFCVRSAVDKALFPKVDDK